MSQMIYINRSYKKIFTTVLLVFCLGASTIRAQVGKAGQMLIKSSEKHFTSPTVIQREMAAITLSKVPSLAIGVPPYVRPSINLNVSQLRSLRLAPTEQENSFQPLTGQQALARFTPGWRNSLAARFTPAQLDAVQAAFENTDHVFFTRTHNGSILFIPQENWNYASQFEQELHALERDFQITMYPLDWKAVFGGRGTPSPLRDIFTFLSIQNFILSHNGKAPSYATTDQEEISLTKKIKYLSIDVKKGFRSDPLSRAIVSLKENHRRIPAYKSPQQWLAEFEKHVQTYEKLPADDSPLYTAIANIKLTLKKKQEANAAQGLPADHGVDPAALQISKLFDKYRIQKTPTLRLEELKQYIKKHNCWPPRGSELYESVKYFRAQVRKARHQNEENGLTDINFQIDPDALEIDRLFGQYCSRPAGR